MKNTRKYILLLMIGLVYSCEETINIDVLSLPANIVIEGLITNTNEYNYIKLTKSRDFYSSGEAEVITNAVVKVTDDLGNQFNYLHNPGNDPELRGVYFPATPYLGVIDRSYTMSVVVNGEEYSATETLQPVTAIDSLTVFFNQDEFDDPEDEGRYFEVLFYAEEPQDRIDYYLFKFYRNGELLKDNDTDIYFADDKLLSGRIDDLPTAGYFAEEDEVKVEMYSMPRSGFIFYNDLSTLLNNDGGLFTPPPANPRSNISNGALGYFHVGAMANKTITIIDPR
ncbi:MAG: hypothetical protein ACI9GZ_003044 [Bacteroidia bacterium]|jgi:hypothetical protein